MKKSLKQTDKASVVNKVREELQDEISALRMQIIDKNSVVQDLTAGNKILEAKVSKLEHENFRCNEELEDVQSKLEDAMFKCDRLAAQAKITETVTANLKQAQEDYQRYIKEGKECYESKEQELKEKFEMLESRLKKRYQAKELELKQEVKESIEEIQRSLEINDSEHLKTRSENLQLKDSIRNLNEKFTENEHNLRAQIEKLELDLQNALKAIREKSNLLERSETYQKLEKNKLENFLAREKELESQIKAFEEKCKLYESKNLDTKKIIDGLKSEISSLKGEVLKENNKVQAKDLEIREGLDREKELNMKINKLKNEKVEEGNKHNKELQDKIESTGNLIKQQVLREYEGKIEDFKAKVSEFQAENKMLKLKIEHINGDNKKARNRERQVFDTKESCNDEALYEELNLIKSKLAKMTSLKNAAEQKLAGVKEELSAFEEKIKQDSSFFRNETMRKDEELMRMKKKFENKLREIYAENSITTEQIRTDILRLHSEVRNRDLKDSGYWLSKSLEDLMKRIPSY